MPPTLFDSDLHACEKSALSKSCNRLSYMPCNAPQMRSLSPPQLLDLPPLHLPPPSEQGRHMPKSCPPRLHSPMEGVSVGGFDCDGSDALDSIDEHEVQTVLSLLQSLEVAWMHDMEEDCDLVYDVPSMGCFQLDDLQITAA